MSREKTGFTLIEIVVAVAVFLLISTIVLNVFTHSSRVRERISSSQNVRNHLQYAVELMSREIRTMKDIDVSQKGNSDSNVKFHNYDCEEIEYCLADLAGNCDANGEYIADNGEIFTSSDIKIEKLNFYINEFQICVGVPKTEIQPSITIFIEGKSKTSSNPQPSLVVQTTISPRFYPYKTGYCAGTKPCP